MIKRLIARYSHWRRSRKMDPEARAAAKRKAALARKLQTIHVVNTSPYRRLS